MQKFFTFFLFFVLVSCSQGNRAFKIPKTNDDIDFTPVKPVEWKLPNGLTVVYVQDTELPIVRGALFMPRGSLWEKTGEFEHVDAMGYMLRQGGTESLDPDKLDFTLEKLAASVESSYSAEFGSVGFSSLNTDFENVFSIFTDVLLRPRFDQSRLDLWKGQMLESIRRRTDDPSTVASISYKEIVYGNNVFGHTALSSEISGITRDSLIRIHKEFVRPEGAYLAIVGDVSRAEIENVLDKYLASWNNPEPEKNTPPTFSHSPQPAIYFLKQPLEQATIYIGQQGPARMPADYTAIEAFNNIFGSGDFGAKLFKKIRTELGLAYSLYGAVIHSYLVGQNIIVIQTKSESASQATVESLKILNEMKYKEVTKEDLELSRKAIKNSHIFKIDSAEDAVKRFIMLKLLKYPEDYDTTYFEKIDAVSTSDIKEVALKYWDLDKLVIVVVGNEKAYNAFKKDLETDAKSLYNLRLLKCDFAEVLGKCI